MFGLFKKKEDEEDFYEYNTGDVLVTFDPDNQTGDVVPVTSINHERVLGADSYGKVNYAVPLSDLKVFTGRKGRIFFYNAPQESIKDTQRLADLEKSTVLQQITRYHDNATQQPIDVMKYVLVGIIGIMGIILALS